MTLFGKALRGIKKGVQATGKGIGNAAKYTAKNPLKVLAPVGIAAGALFTGGAIAPGLAAKFAASKLGKTVVGKMAGAAMKAGSISRQKIAETLKSKGHKATKAEIDAVEKGLQETIQKSESIQLPVLEEKTGILAGLSKLLTPQSEQKAEQLGDFVDGANYENQTGDVEFSEATNRKQAASMVRESVLKYLKMPITWVIIAGMAALYFFNKPKNKRRF